MQLYYDGTYSFPRGIVDEVRKALEEFPNELKIMETFYAANALDPVIVELDVYHEIDGDIFYSLDDLIPKGLKMNIDYSGDADGGFRTRNGKLYDLDSKELGLFDASVEDIRKELDDRKFRFYPKNERVETVRAMDRIVKNLGCREPLWDWITYSIPDGDVTDETSDEDVYESYCSCDADYDKLVTQFIRTIGKMNKQHGEN